MAHIAVCGAGGWGTALAVMASRFGQDVALWSPFEEEIEGIRRHGEHKKLLPGIPIPRDVRLTSDLACAAAADLVLLRVPSFAVGQTAEKLRPHLRPDTVVANAGKGLEEATLRRFSDILTDKLPGIRVAVLSGPSHAEEVGRGCLLYTSLGRRYLEIRTDDAKAERVIAGVKKSLGADGYAQVWTCFQSNSVYKEDIIYKYIRFGMKIGRVIHQKITDERVMRLQKLVSLVGREAGMLRQFIRFSKLEGGIYYGEITPEHNVVAMLMPHFVSRFQIQPFIIHDKMCIRDRA